jgi:hypothetical protein
VQVDFHALIVRRIRAANPMSSPQEVILFSFFDVARRKQ